MCVVQVGRRLVPMLRKGISDAGGVDQACVAKLQVAQGRDLLRAVTRLESA